MQTTQLNYFTYEYAQTNLSGATLSDFESAMVNEDNCGQCDLVLEFAGAQRQIEREIMKKRERDGDKGTQKEKKIDYILWLRYRFKV